MLFRLLLLMNICVVLPLFGGETLVVRADSWCPYNCNPEQPNQGYMIDLLKEIFEKKGYSIDYQLINWSRAIKDCIEGKVDILVGAYKEDCPTCFIPQMPQAVSFNRIFTKKNNPWRFVGKKSLQGQKIGVVQGYTYDSLTDGFIAEKNPSFVVIAGDGALSRLIQMLDTDRISGFYENPNVVREKLKEMNKSSEDYKSESTFSENRTNIYTLICPGKPYSKKLIDALDTGMKTLSKTGKLNSIKKKYEIHE